jgi:RimJ/RimL family protein N-acetyltransferase
VRLRTPRLDLVAATVEHLRGEAAGPGALGRALGAWVPAGWPPPLYDEDAREWMLRQLLANPGLGGFGLWYLLLRAEGSAPPILIGTAGFKGLPSPDGTVEVGYGILEEHQRQGYATETVTALVEWAFTRPRVRRVIAETLPELRASIRVLEKSGFRYVGPGSEEGVIRFERARPAPAP